MGERVFQSGRTLTGIKLLIYMSPQSTIGNRKFKLPHFISSLQTCEVIYEMFHYIELQIRNQVSYDHGSYKHNLSNCV